ncbi:hypothetical protein DES53_11274 [Roseimicrobium gellanilyticum]|uniref:Uncharacterized protein n=1 Tax=Roseimicrobium gellanilyticum TaxID=748857 RepID=A0A366H7P4_9BACT|nr:hypothetical protein [Roseimicrobium gellanilyticum]RBP38076.1 hypothetical protein DES53_11274 [Roseimicrobium gellanilyticum]
MHELVIRTTHGGVGSNRLIPSMLHEWRKPRCEAFEPRNIWSLYNAFTESLKVGNLAELPNRTETLNGLLDAHVELGLNRELSQERLSSKRGPPLAIETPISAVKSENAC